MWSLKGVRIPPRGGGVPGGPPGRRPPALGGATRPSLGAEDPPAPHETELPGGRPLWGRVADEERALPGARPDPPLCASHPAALTDRVRRASAGTSSQRGPGPEAQSLRLLDVNRGPSCSTRRLGRGAPSRRTTARKKARKPSRGHGVPRGGPPRPRTERAGCERRPRGRFKRAPGVRRSRAGRSGAGLTGSGKGGRRRGRRFAGRGEAAGRSPGRRRRRPSGRVLATYLVDLASNHMLV